MNDWIVVGIVALALAGLVVALAARNAARHAAPRRARRTNPTPRPPERAAPAVIDLRERSHGQCPRCGRAETVEVVGRNRALTSWRCGWCDHRWTVGDGEPWPDVTLCLWIPRAPAPTAREAR